MFGRATIRLGIGPHSSSKFFTVRLGSKFLVKPSSEIPTLLDRVAELPCETCGAFLTH